MVWCMLRRFYEQYMALRARIKASSCPTLHRCNPASPTHTNTTTTRSASLRETHRYMLARFNFSTVYLFYVSFTQQLHIYFNLTSGKSVCSSLEETNQALPVYSFSALCYEILIVECISIRVLNRTVFITHFLRYRYRRRKEVKLNLELTRVPTGSLPSPTSPSNKTTTPLTNTTSASTATTTSPVPGNQIRRCVLLCITNYSDD